MKNPPVMDFWVSTAIFLSGQAKTAQNAQGKLLHAVVTEKESQVSSSGKFEISRPPLKDRSLAVR